MQMHGFHQTQATASPGSGPTWEQPTGRGSLRPWSQEEAGYCFCGTLPRGLAWLCLTFSGPKSLQHQLGEAVFVMSHTGCGAKRGWDSSSVPAACSGCSKASAISCASGKIQLRVASQGVPVTALPPLFPSPRGQAGSKMGPPPGRAAKSFRSPCPNTKDPGPTQTVLASAVRLPSSLTPRTLLTLPELVSSVMTWASGPCFPESSQSLGVLTQAKHSAPCPSCANCSPHARGRQHPHCHFASSVTRRTPFLHQNPMADTGALAPRGRGPVELPQALSREGAFHPRVPGAPQGPRRQSPHPPQ